MRESITAAAVFIVALAGLTSSSILNAQGASGVAKPAIKVMILHDATKLPTDREIAADNVAFAVQQELDLDPDLRKYKLQIAFWENKNGYVTLGVINNGNFSSGVTEALMRGDSLDQIAFLVSDSPQVKALIALERILVKLPGLRRLSWTPLGTGMSIRDLSSVSK